MVKSQKPTEQEKSKEFYKSHKKVFRYIEDLQSNASKPISTNLKKQHMFTEKTEFILKRMTSQDSRIQTDSSLDELPFLDDIQKLQDWELDLPQ